MQTGARLTVAVSLTAVFALAARAEPLKQAPTPADPATAEAAKAIRDAQSQYVKAFNAGDATALAAFWAPDGEFVDAEGRSFRGRPAIEKEFGAFFDKAKGSSLVVQTESLRLVAPGVALESGTSRISGPGDSTGQSAAYSIVHTRCDGRWQLASVREIPMPPASNGEYLRPLEWMVGTWTAQGAGRKLDMTCEWTAKRNFLTRRYSLKESDGNTRTGLQVIGWDPVLGGVRSWVFDSDGSFATETWTRDGSRWVVEADGVTRDGAEAVSTNIVTPIDHDSFTWQSVRRSVNEVGLPDTPVVKVTRARPGK